MHVFFFVLSITVLNDKGRLRRATILYPRVHLMGKDAACVAYVRLCQAIEYVIANKQTSKQTNKQTTK